MGRTTKFTTAQTVKIAALYGAGKTDIEVALALGISEKTIYNWKKSHPEFLQALRVGKDVADDKVVEALFARATGYTHPEEKIFCSEGRIVRAKTKKHWPPDVTAQIFWLKNRRPKEWRDSSAQIPPPSPVTQGAVKLTFPQFILNAGYPSPFQRQLDMEIFGFTETVPRMLLGARGYGKTDYLTVMGVAYWVYCDWFDHVQTGSPLTETNLIITKSKSRNTAIIQEVGEALLKNGVTLDKQNASCIRVQGLVGKEHSVEVLTIKSSFRGRHPKRILMDDPVTEEDTSEAMRVLVKKKYDEAYKLCKNIVIIGQPAHAYDLYAELRPLVKTLEIPHGQIPELDADLVAMKLAGVDPHSIEMSYHLRVPTSGTMPFSMIKRIDKLPTGDAVAFLDPSDGGDFTAVSIIKGYMEAIAVRGHAWQRPWYHCLDDLIPILVASGVKQLCFETNKFGRQPISQLQEVLAPYGIGVIGKNSDSNKEAMILAAGSFAHMIHLSQESDKAYTDQVVKYEYSSKFDDAPDSLARGLEWLGLLKSKK